MYGWNSRNFSEKVRIRDPVLYAQQQKNVSLKEGFRFSESFTTLKCFDFEIGKKIQKLKQIV